MPSRITFKTHIAVTDKLYERLGGKRQVKKWVSNLVKDANKYFKISSLETKLTIQVMKIHKVQEKFKYDSDVADDDFYNYERGNHHLGVLGLATDGHESGKASRGSTCQWLDKTPRYRPLKKPNFIIRMEPRVKAAAALFAHEIGHVVGMQHNSDTECHQVSGGLMNRSIRVRKPAQGVWTRCNNAQMKEHYKKQGYLCL